MTALATRSTCDTPRRILDAAVRLFAASGFSGTTTRTIAQEAGVNEALIFRYFPTKRDLYAAIIQNKIEHARTRELVEAASQPGSDERATLRAVALGMFQTVREDQSFMRLLYFSALERHELASLFHEEFSQRFLGLLREVIARGAAEGRLKPLDPLLAARAFLGMVVHTLLLQELFSYPLHCTNENAVEGFLDILFHGIQAREHAPPGSA